MSSGIRQTVCLQVTRSTNPLLTIKCLARPSYAAAYLDIARRAFSNSRPSPSVPTKLSLTIQTLRNKNVGLRYYSSTNSVKDATPFVNIYRTKGITAHSIAKSPLDRRKANNGFNHIYQRAFHMANKPKRKIVLKRDKSSTTKNGAKPQEARQNVASNTPKAPQEPPAAPKNETQNYLHIPKMPHRPTREEVLAMATGFWSGLKLRFKWFSIRSARPWNADDWSAFVSWFFLGHIVWIFVGTTTFFSIVIFTINTVVAQGK